MVKKVLLVAVVLAHTACAAAPKRSDNATSKRVIVTGSHIPREGGDNLATKSLSPMRVYGEDDLDASGRANTADQINRIDVSSSN